MDECAQLARLSQVNQRLHGMVGLASSSTHGSRTLWLQLGLRITGYSPDQVPFDVHHPHFKRCLQQLLCPWLSTPRPLSFKLPHEVLGADRIWRVRILPWDATTLHYEIRHQNYDETLCELREAEAPEAQYLLPSYPCHNDAMPILGDHGGHAARLAHDAALRRMMDVVKRDGILMHTCKALRFKCLDLEYAVHTELWISALQVSMGNHLSLRLVHDGAFAVISALCKVPVLCTPDAPYVCVFCPLTCFHAHSNSYASWMAKSLLFLKGKGLGGARW